MSVQQRLHDIYHEEFDSTRLAACFSADEARRLSAPFMLSVEESYFEVPLKILFVGKETNKWWGSLDKYIQTEGAVEKLVSRHRKEILEEPRWNNRFFVEYKRLRKELAGNQKGAIIWTNLMKMDFEQNKGYSRNSKDHSQALLDMSKRVFLKEVEALQPDVMVFATSHTYDSVLKYFFPGYQTLKVFEKRSLWKFQINDTVCYRTWHPQTIRSRAERTVPEYYEAIIGDIRENLLKMSDPIHE